MTDAPTQTQPPVQYLKAPSNGLATASLVLGIIGVVFAVIPILGVIGAVIGGVGLLLGIFGFLASGKHGVGKGKSIAGLVLGVASIVVFIVISAATVAAVNTAVDGANKSIKDQQDTSSATDVSNKTELADAKLGPVKKGQFGTVSVKVTLTNKSANRSDYMGTVVFESANGARQFDTGALFVENLEPDQTKVENVMMLDNLPKGVSKISARLTDFDRSQSY
jgi:hypothetical protein